MAKKRTTKPAQQREDNRSTVNASNNIPANSSQEDITPRIADEPATTFDERTSSAQPFMTPDGRQDNGQENLDEVEGSRGRSSREGNTSTVEETDKAIDEGIVEGQQNKAEL